MERNIFGAPISRKMLTSERKEFGRGQRLVQAELTDGLNVGGPDKEQPVEIGMDR